MKCSRWHERIALYSGGDLGPRDALRVEKHLEGCPACRELSEALQNDRELLIGFEVEALDGVTFGSVHGEALAQVEGRSRSPITAVFVNQHRAVVAAALVVVLATLVVMWPRGGPQAPRIAEEIVEVPAPFPTAATVNEVGTVVSEPAAETAPAHHGNEPPRLVREQPILVASAEPPSSARSPVVSPSAPVEPMTMKILTDDPDVVIFWIVDSKGEKADA